MSERGLDETDHQLIAALRRDARQSHQAIASTLGVSEGTVRARLKRLETDGVLRVTTIFNINELDHYAIAFLWITCDRERIRDIGKALAEDELIGFAASILGRADVLAITYQESSARIVDFVDTQVKRLPGVIDVRIEPILSPFKNDARWGLVNPPKS